MTPRIGAYMGDDAVQKISGIFLVLKKAMMLFKKFLGEKNDKEKARPHF
jgi:hypothetical protein